MRLPRHVADKRVFCGTALIEFSTEEDAEKVLKESLVYAGAKLELKPKYVCFEIHLHFLPTLLLHNQRSS